MMISHALVARDLISCGSNSHVVLSSSTTGDTTIYTGIGIGFSNLQSLALLPNGMNGFYFNYFIGIFAF